ncbi:arylsulfatase I-like [Gouania willdenowi]|uniref:Arylsulfatase I-like n=1 Tax=Gouania willdenowi TaxID=441366 RepID=A0A8C5I9H5_GOUWI|nr:arylsulfatase I-like [Gouania willdenowi]XP_028329368.1 arylsulfatase I-like [Gouania willdenowi]
MQTLAVLSVLLSLHCLPAHRAKLQPERDGATQKNNNQPHIVFILIDDQGFNDIGYHNPTIKTPTLDKLAAEGVRLENYYVQPICTPSRSQLLTGRYQIHTGLQHSIIRPRQPSCLPSHMDTLPERLQEAGYSTHMVGKWHLGFYRKSCLPTRKGFDSFFGSLTGSVDYYSYGSCDGPGLCGYDLHEGEGVAWGQEGKYSTTLFTQRARKILESHDPNERPLFLLLSLQAVHTPLQPPKSYIYPYRDMANVARRKFAAMVSTVDEAVRNVTYDLRKLGYYRNSIIIYSTDNGAQPFTGGSNWPLRGRKGTYWEGGVRGVAFVHSPLLKRRRRVSKDLFHITDWFPTLVGLAGGNISQSQGLDGYDVWPALSEGRESPRKEILHNIDPLHQTRVKPSQGVRAEGSSGGWQNLKKTKKLNASKNSALKKPKKKKKKKVLKLKPKQKSAFKLKNTKKHQSFSFPVAQTKSKPVPTPKQKLLPKSAPKAKLRLLSKSHSSDAPTLLITPHPQSRMKTKSRRHLSQNQNLSQSTSTKFLKRRTKSQPRHANMKAPPLKLYPVWDASVQAAIRVGDWKLLTGDPGHGDWVPPQILPTLPGFWWNLERSPSVLRMSHPHKNIWLFNITGDPYERHDLAEQEPDVVQQLLERLAHYNQTAVPVYFPPDDPRANPSQHEGAWVPWAEEEEEDEDKYRGVYKKVRESKKKRKKTKCRLSKLQSFFQRLNTGMMSNRI